RYPRQHRLRRQGCKESRDHRAADASRTAGAAQRGGSNRSVAQLSAERGDQRMSEAQLQSGAKPNVDTWGAFINGDFRPAASGKTFPTFNPGNGEVIAYLAESDEEDIEAAVRAALAAFPAWKRRPGAARAKLLIKLAQLVEANAAKLTDLESLNAGKPIRDSKAIGAVQRVVGLELFAGMATKFQGDRIPVPAPYVNITLREPLGVIGGIIPWNYPLLQAVWKIVPAIAAGNTVVLKPAEQACLSV